MSKKQFKECAIEFAKGFAIGFTVTTAVCLVVSAAQRK